MLVTRAQFKAHHTREGQLGVTPCGHWQRQEAGVPVVRCTATGHTHVRGLSARRSSLAAARAGRQVRADAVPYGEGVARVVLHLGGQHGVVVLVEAGLPVLKGVVHAAVHGVLRDRDKGNTLVERDKDGLGCRLGDLCTG